MWREGRLSVAGVGLADSFRLQLDTTPRYREIGRLSELRRKPRLASGFLAF